jgi:hypothetical protein
MGFRDMRLLNQALLARQVWRLIAFPESLCARVLKARYYPNGNLVDTVFTGNPSSTWSAISYGLELLKKGLIWRVGNGKQIKIWRDSWIPRVAYGKILTPKGNRQIRRVSELLAENGDWNSQLINTIFLPVDADAILKIKPSKFDQDDVLAWQPERSGIFTSWHSVNYHSNVGSGGVTRGSRRVGRPGSPREKERPPPKRYFFLG